MIWMAILLGAAGTYVEKLIGFILPASTLDRPIVRSIAGLLPVSLLAALVIVQTFAAGQAVAVDARLAGLAAAIVALVLRAPFLENFGYEKIPVRCHIVLFEIINIL